MILTVHRMQEWFCQLLILININQIQMGIHFETKLTFGQIAAFKYVPIASCEVERTFSMYKFMFNQRKHNFIFENFTNSLIISCNSEN